jgi:ribonuclease HI
MIAPPALPLEDAAAVHVFTAANSPGGWSVLLRYRRRRRLLSGRAEGETVQRLQLRAALAGLTALKLRDLPVHVYTTSEYLRSGIQWWLPGWKRRDWHTAEGAAVPHRDLWLQLENAGRGLRLKYHLAREPLPPEMAEALAAATLACRAGA